MAWKEDNERDGSKERPHIMLEANKTQNVFIEEKPNTGLLEVPQFEIIKGTKILTTIRRFRVVKNFDNNRHLEGDILEERFENPNYLTNISKSEREFTNNPDNWGKSNYRMETMLWTINYLNANPYLGRNGLTGNIINPNYNAIEFIDEIDAKDSVYFQKNSKLTSSQYKSRIKRLARLNEEITKMKYLMDIKIESGC